MLKWLCCSAINHARLLNASRLCLWTVEVLCECMLCDQRPQRACCVSLHLSCDPSVCVVHVSVRVSCVPARVLCVPTCMCCASPARVVRPSVCVRRCRRCASSRSWWRSAGTRTAPPASRRSASRSRSPAWWCRTSSSSDRTDVTYVTSAAVYVAVAVPPQSFDVDSARHRSAVVVVIAGPWSWSLQPMTTSSAMGWYPMTSRSWPQWGPRTDGAACRVLVEADGFAVHIDLIVVGGVMAEPARVYIACVWPGSSWRRTFELPDRICCGCHSERLSIALVNGGIQHTNLQVINGTFVPDDFFGYSYQYRVLVCRRLSGSSLFEPWGSFD